MWDLRSAAVIGYNDALDGRVRVPALVAARRIGLIQLLIISCQTKQLDMRVRSQTNNENNCER